MGFRLDLSAMGFLLAPFALLSLPRGPGFYSALKTISRTVLATIFLSLLVFGVIDIEFVNFIGRRLTRSDSFLLSEAQGKTGALVWSYIWYIGFNLAVVTGLAFLYFRTKKNLLPQWAMRMSHLSWKKKTGFLISLILFLLLAARGGWQPKPIGLAHASQFSSSYLNNLASPTAFVFMKSFDQDFVESYQFFHKDETFRSLLNVNFPGKSTLQPQNFKRQQNVLIIIMESLATEYTGQTMAPQRVSYTPFIDEMAARGVYFRNSFANGRRSIEALSSIVAGIPALYPEPIIGSSFQQNDFITLAHSLRKHGYRTDFFHGGNNGTMLFDQFTTKVGIQNYIGADEYLREKNLNRDAKDHDGTWGIYDHLFLRHMAERLTKGTKPFFATFFSLSAHNPYKIPEEFNGRFPKGTLEIHESMGYADWSLSEFFKYAKTQDWYEDTLFVITGDHTSLLEGVPTQDEDLFRVPLIFFHPRGIKLNTGVTDLPVQHIDIAPSILDFLGHKIEAQYPLGRSVFREGKRNVVLRQGSKFILVSQDGRSELMAYAGTQYRYEPIRLRHSLSSDDSLDTQLKAAVQYYSQSLFENDLYDSRAQAENSSTGQ